MGAHQDLVRHSKYSPCRAEPIATFRAALNMLSPTESGGAKGCSIGLDPPCAIRCKAATDSEAIPPPSEAGLKLSLSAIEADAVSLCGQARGGPMPAERASMRKVSIVKSDTCGGDRRRDPRQLTTESLTVGHDDRTSTQFLLNLLGLPFKSKSCVAAENSARWQR